VTKGHDQERGRHGRAGKDTLSGGLGPDTLDGGGTDVMEIDDGYDLARDIEITI
jgi:hypothetical protein